MTPMTTMLPLMRTTIVMTTMTWHSDIGVDPVI
jgi:hypothetical protein